MEIREEITKILKDEGVKATYISVMIDGQKPEEWFCVYLSESEGQSFYLTNKGDISVNSLNFDKEPEEQEEYKVTLSPETIGDIVILQKVKDSLLKIMKENPPAAV